MKKYIRNYLKHFGYYEGDFIPSEINGELATVLHHIQFGRFKRSDDVTNIIAISHSQHEQAHGLREPRLTREELQQIHNDFMNK